MTDQQASSPSSQDARPQEESPERLARPLIQLAKLNGISTSYIDQLGTYVEIRDEVLVSVLAALGVDASSDDAIETALQHMRRIACDQLVPPTIVVFNGTPSRVAIHAHTERPELSLTCEDGSSYPGDLAGSLCKDADADPTIPYAYTLTMPDDLPVGYHTLRVTDGEQTAEATVLCAPARIPVPEPVAERHRWGWMTQLYSVRSTASWAPGSPTCSRRKDTMRSAAGSRRRSTTSSLWGWGSASACPRSPRVSFPGFWDRAMRGRSPC